MGILITKDLLRQHNACSTGYAWFLEHFPDGEAPYQKVLNALASDDQVSHALWLVEKLGVTAQPLPLMMSRGSTCSLPVTLKYLPVSNLMATC